jgi:hypothetical protein
MIGALCQSSSVSNKDHAEGNRVIARYHQVV